MREPTALVRRDVTAPGASDQGQREQESTARAVEHGAQDGTAAEA